MQKPRKRQIGNSTDGRVDQYAVESEEALREGRAWDGVGWEVWERERSRVGGVKGAESGRVCERERSRVGDEVGAWVERKVEEHWAWVE